jgi:methionyl-tRNA formyltransferase
MLGTGDFALPTFEHLCDTGHRIVALITQPDRPQGRKQERIASPIKRAAIGRGVPVEQPEDVNAAGALERVRALAPDLLVTADFGQILSADLLAIPPLGGINLHGSILPAYRGAAPVARAIEHGERESGVSVIRMTPKIDAGGVIAVARTPIDPDETTGELEQRLARLGAPLVADSIGRLVAGTAEIMSQDKTRVTKAPKLRKDEGLIDWSKPARAVHDKVRAYKPWPVAFTFWHRKDNPGAPPVRIIVHQTEHTRAFTHGKPGDVIEAGGDRLIVAAGAGVVRLLVVQLEGKKPGPVSDFLRGHRVAPGDRMAGPDAESPGPEVS